MVIEHAGNRRGFFGSLFQIGFPMGVAASTGIYGLMLKLPEADFQSWGWRVPFLVSILCSRRARRQIQTDRNTRVQTGPRAEGHHEAAGPGSSSPGLAEFLARYRYYRFRGRLGLPAK
jgi:MFS family permease